MLTELHSRQQKTDSDHARNEPNTNPMRLRVDSKESGTNYKLTLANWCETVCDGHFKLLINMPCVAHDETED